MFAVPLIDELHADLDCSADGEFHVRLSVGELDLLLLEGKEENTLAYLDFSYLWVFMWIWNLFAQYILQFWMIIDCFTG